VNVTELGPHGQIVAPLFMGANPARVPSGPREGLRLLAAEEDLAFELLHALEPHQRARATIAAQTFGDIVTRSDPTVRPMAFAGLPAAEMTIAQQRQLRRLLELYAGRMADTSAHRQLQRIEDAGFERLHFAWAGAHQPRSPHYYRIHGPTVLVEYDNTQNGANHIHTVWRDLENDFGRDLLRSTTHGSLTAPESDLAPQRPTPFPPSDRIAAELGAKGMVARSRGGRSGVAERRRCSSILPLALPAIRSDILVRPVRAAPLGSSAGPVTETRDGRFSGAPG
jgi:hypothetical protein